MLDRLARRVRVPLLAAVGTLALAGCAQEVADPTQGLAVVIKAPPGADSPFANPDVKFVALIAEGPGLPTESSLAPNTVQPYTGPGQTLVMPSVPYGLGRQIRVELYPADANGIPTFPVLGRGRTVPTDVDTGSTHLVHAYVTRTNNWTSPVSDQTQEAKTDARVGLGAELQPDGGVIIAGGADAGAGSTAPFEATGLGKMSKVVLRYDAGARVLQNLSAPPVSAQLSTGRALMATATGFDGQVVFSGGYVEGDLGPVASNLMEYWDPKEAKIKQSGAGAAHLEFARAHHTATRLFDSQEYYMVAGGKGPQAEAAVSWEIWHPLYGRLQKGSLSKARWNHSTVRLPEKDGGYIMLIGGENESGPIDDFEVLRYDTAGNVSFKGNTKITCYIGTTAHTGADSNDKCAALKGQPGYKEFAWEPLVRKLNGSIARTLAGAVFVSNGATNHIYIVGGFADAAHTQPLSRVDVFDIVKGDWLGSVPQLESARGAPQLAVTRGGQQAGRVVVAGGIDAQGRTLAKAEVLYYDSAAGATKREWADGEIPGGGRVAGRAIGLPTGHVMVIGGAAATDGVFVASDRIGLYNPR
ncbi:MAG: hypothetical protein H6747_00715 [Deltaproteobacteria bacterium]|nr:hypothetical protein [Deltaproteobacteria bacterium]